MPDFGGPGILFPHPLFIAGTNTTALNTTNTQVANVIIGAKALANINRIKFYLTAVTTSGQIRASLQQVGSGGNPNGTILASGLYTPSSAGLHTVTLNQSVSISNGSQIAVVLDNYSGSADITVAQVTYNDPKGIQVYADYYASGAWTKQARNFVLYGTDSNGVPTLPMLPHIVATTYNSGSSPDEYGVRVTIPLNATIIGGWVQADLDGPVYLSIYTPSGTQYTASADQNTRNNTNVSIYHFYCPPFDVTANQKVIVSVMPTSTTNVSAYRYYHSVDTTSMPYMCPGYGYTEGVQRTDSGSWSTNTAPLIGGVIIGSINTSEGGVSRARVQGGM
jgi:hypothetical protein